MATALAQSPTHHFNLSIPHEIYQPLLEIAQHNFDTNDVLQWYIMLKQQLHPLETTESTAAYALTPPFSICSPVVPALEPPPFSNEPTHSSELTKSPQHLHELPKARLDIWAEHFSLNQPDQNVPYVTTSSSTPPSLAYSNPLTKDANGDPRLSTAWSSPSPAFPKFDPSELSAMVNETDSALHPARTSTPSYPWFGPGSLNSINSESRKRRISQTSPYQITMSSTAMPLLVPSESPSSYLPITTSTEVTYLPPISIIPSRKRRKTSSKGVKKFIQPFQLQRQSI